MSNALMMAIIATLRPAPAPPATGLTYISTSRYASSSAATYTVPIPAAAVAGDTMLALVAAANGSAGAITIPVAWDVDVYGSSPVLGGSTRAYAYLHYLTAADISAGSIAVTCSVNHNTLHAMFIAGKAAVDTFNITGTNDMPTPVNIAAPSITTTSDGDLIVFHAAGYRFGVTTAPTFSTPGGYTLAAGPQTPTYCYAMTAYQMQGSHGVVPSASTSTNYPGTTDTNGVHIALKVAP